MKTLILFLICCFCLGTFAQYTEAKSRNIDSLKLVFNTSTDDSTRLITLLRWNNLIYETDPALGLQLDEMAVSLCDSNLVKDISPVRRAYFVRRRANCIGNIGIAHYYFGDYDKAVYYFNESLIIQREKGDQIGIGLCLNNLGVLYNAMSDFPRALDYFDQSFKVSLANNDSSGIAKNLSNMAGAFSDLGDYNRALEYNRKSLTIYQLIGDSTGVAMNCTNIGNIYERLRNNSTALLFYQRSLIILETLGHLNDMALLLGNMGIAYQHLRDFDKAESSYLRSLKMREELGDKLGIANVYNNLGSLYRDKSDFKTALDYGLKSLAIANEIKSPSQIKYAQLFLLYYYVRLTNFQFANNCGQEVIAIDQKAVRTNFVILSEKEKELYFNTFNTDYALYNSFALLAKTEIPTVTETVYNNTLTNKGLLLKSSTAMRYAILGSGDDQLIQEYKDWIDLKKTIAKLYGQGELIDSLDKKANEMERNLVKNSTFFSDLDRVQKLTWKDVQSNLKETEAAIEFIHFKQESFIPLDTSSEIIYCALVVKSDSKQPEMIPLFEEQELTKILGDFPGNNLKYIEKLYGKNDEQQNKLYQLIWEPIEKHLTGIKRVYYSPSGLLHKISFAALSKTPSNFLCDDYQLLLKTSTGKVVIPDDFTFDNSSSTTIFGGITYNSDSTKTEIWNYLEGTENEALNIQAILKKNQRAVSYFHHMDATEETFKSIAGSSAIIHIATHGFFYPDPAQTSAKLEIEISENNNELVFRGGNRAFGYSRFLENKNPLMRSGLVLAKANDVWNKKIDPEGDDGVLTAEEVAHLDLRKTGLVVLSACETGLGDVKDGEGVYGLQRAFKMAGVKYVIMSLWQVPDKETAEFMTLFYRRLMAVKDVKIAFAQTQKVMRKKYDPYYWAAFVLIE